MPTLLMFMCALLICMRVLLMCMCMLIIQISPTNI
jgi:hypothetical protein